MSQEEWRPIPGWNYSASSLGRIRRDGEVVTRTDGRPRTVPQKILTPGASNGYENVSLCREGVCSSYRVHRLVMWAFHGPRMSGTDVRHLNGDRDDNRLENLTYGTRSENEYDKIAHGRHPQASKSECRRKHKYQGANLAVYPSRPNHRVCRSCSSARSHISRHPDLAGNLQEISDHYYKEYMNG